MRHNRSHVQRAFTLVEILVVVAIIAVLIAILIPTLSAANRNAKKAAATSQLSALRSGLGQYYTDFNMYPPSSPGNPNDGITPNNGNGASRLAQGLLGFLPGAKDGAGTDAPFLDSSNIGFRLSKTGLGKIYGPYASMEPNNYDSTRNVFIDPWGNDVIYYVSSRAKPGYVAPITPPNTPIFGPPGNIYSYFVMDDCSNSTAKVTGSTANPISTVTPNPLNPKGTAAFFNLMNGTTSPNINGAVTGSSSYILMSAGPDEIYFTADDVVVAK